MPNSAGALRRWLGMFCLAFAAGLLIWGRTFLQPHLSGRGFVLYWTACALLALSAVAFGVADIYYTLRAVRQERQDLARSTLERIQRNEETETEGSPPSRWPDA